MTNPDPVAVAASLSEAQMHILRHSLGVPDPGQSNMYRNHFVTGEGSLDHPHCVALTNLGLMTRHKGNPITGGMDAFFVTNAGKDAVRQVLLDNTSSQSAPAATTSPPTGNSGGRKGGV